MKKTSSNNLNNIGVHPHQSVKSKGENEMDEFYLGIEAFNQQDYPKAHHIWEHSWMRIGESGDRSYLKPFIMLAVSPQNYELNKVSGGNYLFDKALERMIQNKKTIDKYIDVNSLIQHLQNATLKKALLDRFENLYITGRRER